MPPWPPSWLGGLGLVGEQNLSKKGTLSTILEDWLNDDGQINSQEFNPGRSLVLGGDGDPES